MCPIQYSSGRVLKIVDTLNLDVLILVNSMLFLLWLS
jgi:hypothetical protein